MQSRTTTAELPNNPASRTSSASAAQVRSIVLVVLCTVIGAAAQILMRMGAEIIDTQGLMAGLMSPTLLGGYTCYALNTVLLVLALREGELSVLYPIIALTYVWVTFLSPMFFADEINTFKAFGVSLIVVGVAFIGMGSRKPADG